MPGSSFLMGRYRYISILICIFILQATLGSAQETGDSVKQEVVVVPADSALRSLPKPGSVALRSAIVPGWGQLVNKQVWKVPVLYAGLGGIAYFVNYNHKEFVVYRDKWRVDSNNIDLQYRESYRRARDLMLIIGVTVYAANILDAYVFAHLRDFDVSDDLSLVAKPVFFSNIANPHRSGAGIAIQLKFQ